MKKYLPLLLLLLVFSVQAGPIPDQNLKNGSTSEPENKTGLTNEDIQKLQAATEALLQIFDPELSREEIIDGETFKLGSRGKYFFFESSPNF